MKKTTKKRKSPGTTETLKALERENRQLKDRLLELDDIIVVERTELPSLLEAARNKGFREHAVACNDQYKYLANLLDAKRHGLEQSSKRMDSVCESLERVVTRLVTVDYAIKDNTAIVTTMGGWEVFSEYDEDARRTLIDVLAWQVANKILTHYRMNAESLTATVRKSLEEQR